MTMRNCVHAWNWHSPRDLIWVFVSLRDLDILLNVLAALGQLPWVPLGVRGNETSKLVRRQIKNIKKLFLNHSIWCQLQMHDLEYTRYFSSSMHFLKSGVLQIFFPLLHSFLSGVLQIIFSSFLFLNIWSTPDIFSLNGIHYYLEYSRYLFSHFSFLYLDHSR